MTGTLRTLDCAVCRKVCCVESLSGEYEKDEEMPSAPTVICFDCAAEMVAKVSGAPRRLVTLGVAICRTLGALNDPSATMAREAHNILREHFANRHDCWTCKHKNKNAHKNWWCEPLQKRIKNRPELARSDVPENCEHYELRPVKGVKR